MRGFVFWILAMAIGTTLMRLAFASSNCHFPDLVFQGKGESFPMIHAHRELKEAAYNGGTKKKRNLSNINVEDYHPIDPVPSSKASVKPGPTPHATPLIPYIPPPTPPTHPRLGGFP